MHELWLDRPLRYSEDLDYVRRSSGGVGELLTALRALGERVGFERITTQVSQHPKARLRTTLAGGNPMSVKVARREETPAEQVFHRGRGGT